MFKKLQTCRMKSLLRRGIFCEVKYKIKNIIFYYDYTANYALFFDYRSINEASGKKYK